MQELLALPKSEVRKDWGGENSRGKVPNVLANSTASRRGHRGIVLETYKFGGRRFTSKEAVTRFLERVNRADPLSIECASAVALSADGI